MQVDATI
jgi:drug/metabolite transporter (DMT)-like permease